MKLLDMISCLIGLYPLPKKIGLYHPPSIIIFSLLNLAILCNMHVPIITVKTIASCSLSYW